MLLHVKLTKGIDMEDYKEVMKELLEFCDDLVDDIFFYNTTNHLMPDEDVDFILNKFNELEFQAKEYGVML